jgi:hypothetical protein
VIQRITVPDEGDDLRLDRFLVSMVALSRSQIQRLIKDGCVLVAGKPAKANHPVKQGQEVSIEVPELIDPAPLPEALPLPIVYQDRDLIVVDKPAGMVVHPAAGHATGTLVNALLHHVDDLSGVGGVMRPGEDPRRNNRLDIVHVNEIKGGVTVNAGTGNNDVLNLDDGGDTSTNTSTLTDQRLSGLSYGDIVYQNLDHLNIWLGTGLQLMTIRSTHAGTETIVTGRDGGGVYNVGGVGGQTQNIQGDLVLRAGAGSDRLIFDDSPSSPRRPFGPLGLRRRGCDRSIAAWSVRGSAFDHGQTRLQAALDSLRAAANRAGHLCLDGKRGNNSPDVAVAADRRIDYFCQIPKRNGFARERV